uniref:Uncharacterized protein n=1 Tax=Anguilla anguilla TaxID=7936 RepID=A0A0E9V0T5_ANGAN
MKADTKPRIFPYVVLQGIVQRPKFKTKRQQNIPTEQR